MSEFYYNLPNLFNHVWEIAQNPQGKRVYFYLDGLWKIIDVQTNAVERLHSATDICAWLNRYEFKPTGKKVEL